MNFMDDYTDDIYNCAICGKSQPNLIELDYGMAVYVCDDCYDLMTDRRCPECGEFLFKEVDPELAKEYPYVCAGCQENFYGFETIIGE